MATTAAMSPDGQATVAIASERGPIAIICGGGSLPGAVAEAAVGRGRRPIMLAIKGWADAKTVERYAHHWIALGQVGRLIRLARAEHCREAVFIGTLLRPPIAQIRLDWLTLRSLPKLIRFYRGGDDRLLIGIAGVFEEGGLPIVGLDELAPELFAPQGMLGGCAPSMRDHDDIAHGLKVIRALGPFDVGQAVVVANHNIIAVEAAEGTDNMLLRLATMREQGRIATPRGVGVLVKAPKPGQDRRFDLPAIGPRTVENVARAGLAGLAVAAGSTMIAEAAEVIAAADRTKIFFIGVGEEAAP
jgi:UDP-2,3-diacylglucosamine hydrolase